MLRDLIIFVFILFFLTMPALFRLISFKEKNNQAGFCLSWIVRKKCTRKHQFWGRNSLDCFVVRIRVIVSVSFPRTSEYRILSLNWFLNGCAFFAFEISEPFSGLQHYSQSWHSMKWSSIASLNHILKTWLNNCKTCLNLKRSQEGESCQPSLSLSSPCSSSQPL